MEKSKNSSNLLCHGKRPNIGDMAHGSTVELGKQGASRSVWSWGS